MVWFDVEAVVVNVQGVMVDNVDICVQDCARKTKAEMAATAAAAATMDNSNTMKK